MLDVFFEHKLLSGITLALLLLSIVCQIMIGVIYQKMIKEADNMSATSNKLLKQFKLKFTNCYKMNEGVSNISVFVDKFIGKISFLKISLTSLQHLSGQLMLLSVAAAGVGACREIIKGETVGTVLPFYIAAFLGLYVYFSISGLVDISGKKERLKTNLVDYLENHMVKKLKQSETDWAELMLKEQKMSSEQGMSSEKKMSSEQRMFSEQTMSPELQVNLETEKGSEEIKSIPRIKKEEKKAVFSHQEELELEELLKEFFA